MSILNAIIEEIKDNEEARLALREALEIKEQPELLSVSQVAKRLSVSSSTVRKMIKDSKLQIAPNSPLKRILASDLEPFLTR